MCKWLIKAIVKALINFLSFLVKALIDGVRLLITPMVLKVMQVWYFLINKRFFEVGLIGFRRQGVELLQRLVFNLSLDEMRLKMA